MFDKSDSITKLAPALLKAQQSISFAVKDATNPYFKSKYADLTGVIAAVKDPLNENGITFIQAVNVGATPVVETVLLHESGEWMSSITPVYCGKPNDPQALGSGITYAKRYGLQAMLGLPTEDDDGEAAMSRKNAQEFERDVIDKPLVSKPDPLDYRYPTTTELKGITELVMLAATDGYEGLDRDKLHHAIWDMIHKYPVNKDQAQKLYNMPQFQTWLTR